MELNLTQEDFETIHDCLRAAADYFENDARICRKGPGVPEHARSTLVEQFKARAQQARHLAEQLERL